MKPLNMFNSVHNWLQLFNVEKKKLYSKRIWSDEKDDHDRDGCDSEKLDESLRNQSSQISTQQSAKTD